MLRETERLQKARIVLLCIVAACVYGVLHDEVTVRICPEYFTVAHPPYFPATSLTMLALCWGVSATAGIGFALGLILARITRSPGLPPYPLGQLARDVAMLLTVMAVAALLAGFTGFELATCHRLSLPQEFAEEIAPADHARFMAVWFAHGASYLFGLGGGCALCLSLWRARGRPWVMDLFPRTGLGSIRFLVILIVSIFIFGVLLAAFGPHH